MNKEEWVDFLKYLSPYSILIIDYNDKLVEVKCPFNVLVLESISELIKGKVYSVDKIMVSTILLTVFIIKGKAYYYYHFEIIF